MHTEWARELKKKGSGRICSSPNQTTYVWKCKCDLQTWNICVAFWTFGSVQQNSDDVAASTARHTSASCYETKVVIEATCYQENE